MKLLYTPNSPYSRVARVCALQQRLELAFESVAVREQADRILEINPAAMVPTLVLDCGTFLTETRVICEYFDSVGPGGFLAAGHDLQRRHREGLVHNFLDGVAVWVREIRRPAGEQSPGVIELERARTERCLAHFETCWELESTELDFTSTMLASAIELLDTRIDRAWRVACPQLADWYEAVSRHDLLRRTAPHPV